MIQRRCMFFRCVGVCALFSCLAPAATLSILGARGYTVLPSPQQVTLGAPDFRFGPDWAVELAGVPSQDVAVESLREELETRFGLTLGHAAGKAVRLSVRPGAVEIGEAADRDKALLRSQAYRLALSERGIQVTANAPQGLFYGVQTLVQLVRRREGALWLPEAEIVDWPDLQLRQIYWDDAHHLDRMAALKRAVRQASFFKINGFVIKLEGHFQFRSAPALVEPQALSPAELQELTDYGLRRYVQVVPYLDAPAHIAFILKHPEYAKLRAFPDSNYEICATNPQSFQLYYGLFDDLLAANKGVRYFYLSTDEPYYIGQADNAQCREAAAAKQLGSVGKLLAQFVTRLADYLHDRGRTIVFWGEFPLKPDDIASLPAHLVNGEVYGPVFDPLFRKHGIREMIYTSTEGEEKLFPDYFLLPPSRRLHNDRAKVERVASAMEKVSFDSARRNADLMGMIVAGWADMGLHADTFWLGYATATAAGWHPGAPDAREAMAAFYPLYFGPGATRMDRVYQLLSTQAQFWADSWETVPSAARKPIWGNSNQIYTPRRPARDQGLPLPPAPSPDDLSYDSKWSEQNARRLQLAAEMLPENDELTGLLHQNLQRAELNLYSLEVFLAVAQLCRQNLLMLADLGRMDAQLAVAQTAARAKQARQAVAALDRALDTAARIRAQRNAALRDATESWYKTWHPRVAEANGRKFLHEMDDVKDHLPDRTIDMRYLVYRQLLLPFGEWVDKVRAARNAYAQRNSLAVRDSRFDWRDLSAGAALVEETPEE
jgi:hexosaminidase